MKYILILLLIFSYLNAEEKKQTFTVGLGPYIQTQPYKNVDNIVLISPVLFFDNELFYIRWSRAGMYFLGDVQEEYSWGFSFTIQPRPYGYSESDIKGMDERESTWEGGISFSAKTDKAYIEIMALTDILDRYNSWILKSEIGYDLKIWNFSLYPSLITIYQSADFTNYYYGVKKSESDKSTFSEYVPRGGFLIGMQTYIKYPFTDNFATLINIRADRISNEAASSPLVDENFIYSGLVSLIYTFHY